jgi:hypothetical protein
MLQRKTEKKHHHAVERVENVAQDMIAQEVKVTFKGLASVQAEAILGAV